MIFGERLEDLADCAEAEPLTAGAAANVAAAPRRAPWMCQRLVEAAEGGPSR
jgi:hypothetical protein